VVFTEGKQGSQNEELLPFISAKIAEAVPAIDSSVKGL
jgi:hypothetical protein